MADNKSQHFVPRFYLKRFTEREKAINLYNWKAEKGIFNASLKEQCCRAYYYGADLKMEHEFADVEGMVDNYFKLVDQFGVLPKQGSDDHDALLFWIVLQDCRTPYAADTIDEMTEQMVKATLADHREVTQEMLDSVRITHGDPVHAAIYYKAPSYPLLRDMHIKLVVSPPGTEFITSDTPVVSHNQLMEFRRRFGSTVGIGWKGLQMFYPISARLMIMLYDPNVYVVGDRKSHWLFLTDKRDVDELNVLQAAHSYKNFYFNSSRSNFLQVAQRAKPFKRTAKAKTHIGQKEIEPDGKGFSRLIGFTTQEVQMDLNLTFVRMTKPAKAYQAEARAQKKMIPSVVMRSAEVQRLTHEYTEERRRVRKAQLKERDAAEAAAKPREGA